MNRHSVIAFVVVILLGLPFAARWLPPQAAPVAASLAQGKLALEILQYGKTNIEELIILQSGITRLVGSSPDRYKGLTTDLAKTLGLLSSGLLSLGNVEIASAASAAHPYGHYAISIIDSPWKQCLALAMHPVRTMFLHVEVNGHTIPADQPASTAINPCLRESFFQSGKNTIRFIGG
jgi:hypothetical protein